MSTAVRRLVSLGVVAVVVALGAWVYLAQGGGSDGALPTPAPGPVHIDEDTPQLRDLKARFHIETCTPGAATGTTTGPASALPAITLPCLGGGPAVDLSALKGPMLLSLWQSNCGPCKKEMPALEAFARRYGDRVPVLGVDFLDLFPASALSQMHRFGATYPSVADPGGDLQSVRAFAKVTGLPTLFFVDAAGTITYAHPGGVTSESQVADLVRQHLGVDL